MVRDVAGADALAHVVRCDVDVLGAVVVGAVGFGLDGSLVLRLGRVSSPAAVLINF